MNDALYQEPTADNIQDFIKVLEDAPPSEVVPHPDTYVSSQSSISDCDYKPSVTDTEEENDVEGAVRRVAGYK